MDDLRLVQEMRPARPLPEPAALAPARDRLTAALAAPVRHRHRRRPVRRIGWVGWAAASMAAAVAAVVVTIHTRPPEQPPPVLDAQAVELLHDAAAAALKLPDVQPRPDQFLYVRTVSDSDSFESWHSIDGIHDGLQQTGDGKKDVLLGCRDGHQPAMKGDKVVGTQACTTDPAYLPDLPTDPNAMLAYLTKDERGNYNAVGKDVLDLAASHYLRPQARAALFQAAAKVPGLRVVRGLTDGAGRPGVAIAWTYPGMKARNSTMYLIFDPQTYALTGSRYGQYPASAITQVAIVDRVGQRP